MRILKKLIKQFIGFFIVCLLPVLINKRKNQTLILSYHRILPYSHPEYNKMQPGMVVSDEAFRRHLLWLKKWFDIVSFLDFRKGVAGRKKPLCIITIDDGWVDNYTYAFPILKELNIPATIFLVSNMLDTDKYFWPEKLSLLLDNTLAKVLLKKYLSEQYASELMDFNNVDEVVELLKSKRDEDIIENLENIEEKLVESGLTLNTHRQILNVSELKEMYESGLVNYGSHTANHIRLDKVSMSKVQQELNESKKQLEAMLDITISTFCYPNGSYTDDVVDEVSKIYAEACSTNKGWVGMNCNKCKLNRILLHDDISSTKGLFWGRVLGIL